MESISRRPTAGCRKTLFDGSDLNEWETVTGSPVLQHLDRAHLTAGDRDARRGIRLRLERDPMTSRRKRPAPVDPRNAKRADGADAFLPDPEGGPARTDDDLSESLGEGFVEAATSGEDRDEEMLDAAVPEELGGPFVTTSPAEELAHDIDASNPPDATREPLPRAMPATSVPGADADEKPRRRRRRGTK